MTVRGLADLKEGTVEGRCNIGYIWGYREYMRRHVRIGKCPKRYGKRETLGKERTGSVTGLDPRKRKAEEIEGGERNTQKCVSRDGAMPNGEVQITGATERWDEPTLLFVGQPGSVGNRGIDKKGDGNYYV